MSDAASTTTEPSALPRVILVPGFWLGAWAWEAVADVLRADGLEPLALTLPGLHPGSDPSAVSMEDHIRAIEAAIGDGPVVLVAHSGAAFPATAALDRHPEAVRHVVWVDTCPVVDGAAMDASLTSDALPIDAVWHDEFEQGSMRGLTDEQLAAFRDLAVPQPGGTVREAVALHDERRLDVPQTLVATAYSADEYRRFAAEGVPFLAGLGEQRALETVDVPTGHWPMWSAPEALAEIIARVTRAAR